MSLQNERLVKLLEIATDAHSKIQADFNNIDPVIGVSQKMRALGIPTDVMTIDCLKSGKRILVVLNDQDPDNVDYQYTFKQEDPAEEFLQLPYTDMSSSVMYNWIKDYFAPVMN